MHNKKLGKITPNVTFKLDKDLKGDDPQMESYELPKFYAKSYIKSCICTGFQRKSFLFPSDIKVVSNFQRVYKSPI